MQVIELKNIDPTLQKMGEMIDLKAEKENASPKNREVELHDIDLTTRIVIVKDKAPHLASYARGPIEKSSVNKRWHSIPSKQKIRMNS